MLPTFESVGTLRRRSLRRPEIPVRERRCGRPRTRCGDLPRGPRARPTPRSSSSSSDRAPGCSPPATAVSPSRGPATLYGCSRRETRLAARALLWHASARSARTTPPNLRWVTPDQRWAIDVMVAGRAGAAGVRGAGRARLARSAPAVPAQPAVRLSAGAGRGRDRVRRAARTRRRCYSPARASAEGPDPLRRQGDSAAADHPHERQAARAGGQQAGPVLRDRGDGRCGDRAGRDHHRPRDRRGDPPGGG